MALCRFLVWNTPLHHRPLHHQIDLPKNLTTFSFSCPAFLSTKFRTTFSSLSSSMDSPPQGYRHNVGICLINPSKKIFAASRLDIPDSWQMPQEVSISENTVSLFARYKHPHLQTYSSRLRICVLEKGGIDEGEDPRNAAIRELSEETGVTSVEVLAEVPHWVTYDFPPEVREKLKCQWGSDWKGQAQKWFLLKFLGNEDEINLMGDGKEKPEFGKWSWMSSNEVVQLAVDFKRPVYEEVLKAFAPYLQ